MVGEEDNTLQENIIREQISSSRGGKHTSKEGNAWGGGKCLGRREKPQQKDQVLADYDQSSN